MRAENDHVIWELIETANLAQRKLNQTLRSQKLSATGYHILSILEDAPEAGLPCSHVEKELETSVPDMTRLLDRLIGLGHIERSRCELDRRLVLVRITGEGVIALDALRSSVQNVLHDACALMMENNQLQLKTALRLIREQVREP